MTPSWPACAVSSGHHAGHCPTCLLRLMSALGSISQELRFLTGQVGGSSCKGRWPCRARSLEQLGLCLQAGAGGGGEDPGYERPRGTAFGAAGARSPRREARPRRAAAEAAAPDPRTKPKVSNSEWTIARKLFYVQGKQVTSGSDASGASRSSWLPHWKAGHRRVFCSVFQGTCNNVAALHCEACCLMFWGMMA